MWAEYVRGDGVSAVVTRLFGVWLVCVQESDGEPRLLAERDRQTGEPRWLVFERENDAHGAAQRWQRSW